MTDQPAHPQRGEHRLRNTSRLQNPREDNSETASAAGLLLPGGKVDAAAIHRALEEAASEGIEDDSELRRVTFTLQHDLKKRLDKYLTDRITFMSRTSLQRLIDDGGVLVNQRVPKASTVLRAGDCVEVVIPPPPDTEIRPEDIPLDVLYEDEQILVINKSPDIIVHPARSHRTGTMINAVAFHVRRSGGDVSGVGKEFARPGVVHRLDRHTSGCIVFAKQDQAHWNLGHQFEHRRVDKRYLALVHGHIQQDVQVIDLPIGNHPSREKGYREKYVVRHDEAGKNAVTIARVRERYSLNLPAPRDGSVPMNAFTLVELELKTGRTHQIRVHLSYLGWPIAGDDMYGGKSVEFRAADGSSHILARQALHACTLGFTHPTTAQPIAFTAPLRGELAALVLSLRRESGERFQQVHPPGATIDITKVMPPT